MKWLFASLPGVMGFSGFMKGFNGLHRARPRTNFYSFGCFIRSRDFSISNNSAVDDSILPVLIVGAGPVGLVLSILLTKLGIPREKLYLFLHFSPLLVNAFVCLERRK